VRRRRRWPGPSANPSRAGETTFRPPPRSSPLAPGGTPALTLAFWSATPARLETIGRIAGPAWLPGFLAAVTDAAQRAGQELSRLQAAAARAAALRRTARSQLPAAAALALRLPVLTARGLADRLRLSPQAALILLKQLVAAGVLREATGRASWRAFVVVRSTD